MVIASGDLTDHGRPEEYDLLREILSDSIPLVFVIPGNHDRRDVLLKSFAGYEEVAMLAGLTDEARAKLLARNQQDYQELCKSEYNR